MKKILLLASTFLAFSFAIQSMQEESKKAILTSASSRAHVLVKTTDGRFFLLNKNLFSETFQILLTHGSHVPCTKNELEALLDDLHSIKIPKRTVGELANLANLAHFFNFKQLEKKYIPLLASYVFYHYEAYESSLKHTLSETLNYKLKAIFKHLFLTRIFSIIPIKSTTLLEHFYSDILDLAFSPDSNQLALGLLNVPEIGIYHLKSGKKIDTLKAEPYNPYFAFSPHGTIAVATNRKTIKLFHRKTHKEIASFVPVADYYTPISMIAFSPDGKLLASGPYKNTIKIWDTRSGKELKTLTGYTESVQCLSFNPQGTILATGSRDGTVKLWHVKSGKLIKKLNHYTNINCLAFNPEGTILATGSGDTTVRLWHVKSGSIINILDNDIGQIRRLAFSPDGNTLATASSDKVSLWDLSYSNCLKADPEKVTALLSLNEIPDLDKHPDSIVQAFKSIDQHKEILTAIQRRQITNPAPPLRFFKL